MSKSQALRLTMRLSMAVVLCTALFANLAAFGLAARPAQAASLYAVAGNALAVPAGGTGYIQVRALPLQPGANLPAGALNLAAQPLASDRIRIALYYGIDWGYSESAPYQVAEAVWWLQDSVWRSADHATGQHIADAAVGAPGMPSWNPEGRNLLTLISQGQAGISELTLAPMPQTPSVGTGTLAVRNTSGADMVVYLPYGTVFSGQGGSALVWATGTGVGGAQATPTTQVAGQATVTATSTSTSASTPTTPEVPPTNTALPATPTATIYVPHKGDGTPPPTPTNESSPLPQPKGATATPTVAPASDTPTPQLTATSQPTNTPMPPTLPAATDTPITAPPPQPTDTPAGVKSQPVASATSPVAPTAQAPTAQAPTEASKQNTSPAPQSQAPQATSVPIQKPAQGKNDPAPVAASAPGKTEKPGDTQKQEAPQAPQVPQAQANSKEAPASSPNQDPAGVAGVPVKSVEGPPLPFTPTVTPTRTVAAPSTPLDQRGAPPPLPVSTVLSQKGVEAVPPPVSTIVGTPAPSTPPAPQITVHPTLATGKPTPLSTGVATTAPVSSPSPPPAATGNNATGAGNTQLPAVDDNGKSPVPAPTPAPVAPTPGSPVPNSDTLPVINVAPGNNPAGGTSDRSPATGATGATGAAGGNSGNSGNTAATGGAPAGAPPNTSPTTGGAQSAMSVWLSVASLLMVLGGWRLRRASQGVAVKAKTSASRPG